MTGLLVSIQSLKRALLDRRPFETALELERTVERNAVWQMQIVDSSATIATLELLSLYLKLHKPLP